MSDKCIPYNTHCYGTLAMAIIKQAADDFNRFDDFTGCESFDEYSRKIGRVIALEKFFNSSWCDALLGLAGFDDISGSELLDMIVDKKEVNTQILDSGENNVSIS